MLNHPDARGLGVRFCMNGLGRDNANGHEGWERWNVGKC